MRFTILFLLFSAMVSAQTGVRLTNWVELSKGLENAVPRLELQDKEGNGSCSAVIFELDADRNAKALTAAHCVSHAPTETFDFTIDDRHATVELENAIFDLAIVSFKAGKDARAIALAIDSPPPGTDVMVAGYAFGDEEIAFQYGHIAQSRNRGTKDIRLDARIIFGDSGGAIINNQNQLVGITSRVYYQGPVDMGGAVRIETIQNFIDAFREQETKKKKD